MSKKKRFSSRITESLDPMSAFIDDSEELSVPEDVSKKELFETLKNSLEEAIEFEKGNTELATTILKESTEEPVLVEKNAEPDVLTMLHGTDFKVEKNALPVQLLNKEDEKIVVIDAPNVGKLYDLLEVARQHAVGYQSTWDASIKAYARHMGFPSMANLEDSKNFISKWGAKLKD
jgi:hypothetical protein